MKSTYLLRSVLLLAGSSHAGPWFKHKKAIAALLGLSNGTWSLEQRVVEVGRIAAKIDAHWQQNCNRSQRAAYPSDVCVLLRHSRVRVGSYEQRTYNVFEEYEARIKQALDTCDLERAHALLQRAELEAERRKKALILYYVQRMGGMPG
jgi:hypothetical protein